MANLFDFLEKMKELIYWENVTHDLFVLCLIIYFANFIGCMFPVDFVVLYRSASPRDNLQPQSALPFAHQTDTQRKEPQNPQMVSFGAFLPTQFFADFF